MTPDTRCGFRLVERLFCPQTERDHLHQPPETCQNAPERHHAFVPRPPHVHEFTRCACGATADV